MIFLGFSNNFKKSLGLLVFLIGLSGYSQDWQPSFEEAQKMSKKEGKALLLVFAGSDWCAPCMKLEKEIWSSPDFKTFADKELILYKADFPRKKKNSIPEEIQKSNATLATEYNPKGYFPLVLLLNEDGKVLGETGYKKFNPQQYVAHLGAFMQ